MTDAAKQLRGQRKEVAAIAMQLLGLVDIEVTEDAAPRCCSRSRRRSRLLPHKGTKTRASPAIASFGQYC